MMGLIVFGAEDVAREGNQLAILMIIAGVGAGAWLVRREWGAPNPLMPLDLLRIPIFTLSITTSVVSFAAQMLAYVAIPFLFQSVLGRTVFATGTSDDPLRIAVGLPRHRGASCRPDQRRATRRHWSRHFRGGPVPSFTAGRISRQFRHCLAHGCMRTGFRAFPIPTTDDRQRGTQVTLGRSGRNAGDGSTSRSDNRCRDRRRCIPSRRARCHAHPVVHRFDRGPHRCRHQHAPPQRLAAGARRRLQADPRLAAGIGCFPKLRRGMTALDVFVFLLLIGGGAVGFVRGFVHEVIWLLAWVVAIAMLKLFHSQLWTGLENMCPHEPGFGRGPGVRAPVRAELPSGEASCKVARLEKARRSPVLGPIDQSARRWVRTIEGSARRHLVLPHCEPCDRHGLWPAGRPAALDDEIDHLSAAKCQRPRDRRLGTGSTPQAAGRSATTRLHDTMAREKREFVPINRERITMYVCGPTVYGRAHIGNARPAVVFDLLLRLLRHQFGENSSSMRETYRHRRQIIASARWRASSRRRSRSGTSASISRTWAHSVSRRRRLRRTRLRKSRPWS